VGYAPLFALMDRVSEKKPFWNQFEFILFTLSVSLFAANLFNTNLLFISITQAIILTLPFIVYGFARQALGERTIKFTVIFLWLAAEYLFLKSPWNESLVYLADGFMLHTQWLTFTQHSGFLGISLWILICNLLTYQSFFKKGTFDIPWIVAFVVCMIAPPLLAISMKWEPITRSTMLSLYQNTSVENAVYATRGEWIARTAAWISVLVILLSIVKNKTGKK
jgi:hypothetical protein